ncbi:MAG: extracellular solute-binding protein [Lentihominibacter sp.]
MKGRICSVLLPVMAVFSVLLTAACSFSVSSDEKDNITVYLWDSRLLDSYAPYIQSHFPEDDIEFAVGNNDLEFYQFLKDNGRLPDIITNRRFSLHDAKGLQDQLMDLSGTEAAAVYYDAYLDDYRNGDGTVNWLPLCGEVDGIIANSELFSRYDIPLPTDYSSFVSACREFEKHGVRGFISDFTYDYTCLELLQGISIPELVSFEGKMWRTSYENPDEVDAGLDDKVWPEVFSNMAEFIADAGLTYEDAQTGYDEVYEMFCRGEAAMIRGTGEIAIDYDDEDNGVECVMLPYYGQEGDSWLLTYPSFQVALNKDLEEDPERMELAASILDLMISEEGQNALAEKHDVIPYTKDVDLELSGILSNLDPYIRANHLYIRLASNEFFEASRDVVQKMITGEYNAKTAYEEFNRKIRGNDREEPSEAASFDKAYEYDFSPDGGNPASSAVANSLRKMLHADVLISPYYNFTGPVIDTDYSEKMLGYMIMPNNCRSYVGDMTGREVKKLVEAAVSGTENGLEPLNMTCLPVFSGISVEVQESGSREFEVSDITAGGSGLKDDEVYTVAYIDAEKYYNQMIQDVFGSEGAGMLRLQEENVRNAWVRYISEGNGIEEPSEYINLR